MAADTTKTQSWISKTPDVCGGDACIRNTRITVNGLVEWRKLGLSDQRILAIIEGLTPEDLTAAWEYYRLNQAEIDEEIRLNNEA
jgi:type III restriction enzyme